MILFDVRTKETVVEVEEREQAVQVVGAIMSYFGRKYVQGRFMLLETPDKKGAANVFWGADELYRRAHVYYTPKHKEMESRYFSLLKTP